MQKGLYWRLWCDLAEFAGVSLLLVWSLESSGPFCVGAFCINMALVGVKMFSHLIYFEDIV
jgi:hypothetical protein